jgi:hypothetical protein
LNEPLELFELLFVSNPFTLWHFHIPGLGDLVDQAVSSFVDEKFELRIVGQPKEPLCPRYLPPERPVFFVGYQFVEFDWIKRPSCSIDETRYVVFNSFRDILGLVSFSHPPLADLRLLKVEPFLEDLIQIDLRVLAEDDLRVRVNALNIAKDIISLLLANKIDLVNDHQVSNFELIKH